MDTTKNPGITFNHPPTDSMVSVIIPLYNRESTIIRAVQSVLNQTYSNLEVIIVDDCSTDNSVKTVKSLSDPRVRLIELETNGGACRARNIGAANANGEFIAFQDSDDEWLPDKLEKQLAFMQSGQYDFTFCQANLILLDGKILKSPKDSYGHDPDRDWYHVLMTDFPVSTQKFICHRSVMEKVGFDESLCKSQDKDFALQVAHDFKVGYLAQPLVNIYAMQGSITFSKNTQKKYDSILRTVEKHHQEIAQDPNAQSFYYANLGDFSYSFDRKLALSWYRKSLNAIFSKKVLVKYLLTCIGLRKYF